MKQWSFPTPSAHARTYMHDSQAYIQVDIDALCRHCGRRRSTLMEAMINPNGHMRGNAGKPKMARARRCRDSSVQETGYACIITDAMIRIVTRDKARTWSARPAPTTGLSAHPLDLIPCMNLFRPGLIPRSDEPRSLETPDSQTPISLCMVLSLL